MNRALLEIIARSWRGRLRRSARLAKTPKYWIGLILGALYLFWILRNAIGLRGIGGGHALPDLLGASPELRAGLLLVGSVALALMTTIAWLLPGGRSGLRLTEAELHTLTTAPIARRQVIQYALLKNQIGLMTTSVLLPLILSPGTIGMRLASLPAYWMVLTLLDLHLKGIELWKLAGESIDPARAERRRWWLRSALVLFWLALLVPLSRHYDAIRDAITTSTYGAGPLALLTPLLTVLGQTARDGWLHAQLAPWRWALEPLAARSAAWPWLSWLPALALVALHYEWVVRSRAHFEEAVSRGAREQAQRGTVAGRIQRMRPLKRQRVPFRLDPTGPAEVAILWKSLAFSYRSGLARQFGWIGVAVVGSALVIAALGAPEFLLMVISGLAVVGLSFTLFSAGPAQTADLRRSFSMIDVVRTWPVTPQQLLRVEVLAAGVGAIIMSAASLGALLSVDAGCRLAVAWGRLSADAGNLLRWSDGYYAPAWLMPWLLALGVLIVLAAIGLFTSALQHCVLLAWPAFFVQDEAGRQTGLAASGQRILWGIGLFVALGLTLLPSVLLLLLTYLFHQWIDFPLTAWEFPLLGLLSALPLLVVTALLVRTGSELWLRLDPTREVLPS